MKTEPTFISNESLNKQPVNHPASHYRVISLIKLTFYIAVLIGFCWLLSCIITKEVVIAIGLLISFILISSIIRFAFSVILTIIKWIVIATINDEEPVPVSKTSVEQRLKTIEFLN